MYPLAQKLFHTLKPGGTATHQISIRLPVPIPANAPVVQIFFPGTIATPYIHFLHDCERAGFRVTHQSIVDYRPTLRHWFDRLVANRERAIELAGVRAYNRYLCFFPCAWRFFDDGIGMTIRISMEKPSATQRLSSRKASNDISMPNETVAGELVGAGAGN